MCTLRYKTGIDKDTGLPTVQLFAECAESSVSEKMASEQVDIELKSKGANKKNVSDVLEGLGSQFDGQSVGAAFASGELTDLLPEFSSKSAGSEGTKVSDWLAKKAQEVDTDTTGDAKDSLASQAANMLNEKGGKFWDKEMAQQKARMSCSAKVSQMKTVLETILNDTAEICIEATEMAKDDCMFEKPCTVLTNR